MTDEREVEDLLRTLAPQVLGALARRTGDFDASEDAVQEALLVASQRWPRDGIPERPRGWLLQTAQRKLVDLWRSDDARRRRERLTATHDGGEQPGVVHHDDTLTVLLLCCHPSLTPASAIALTLRAVGGLTTAQVASAFLVPEATMAQRISRAKATIRASGTAFGPPSPEELPQRLGSVLHVLYLVFNEGYAASAGSSVHRTDLTGEAVRLTRMAHRLLPDDPEVTSLLALMLLTDARRPARTTSSGDLVPLAEQDRSRWDAAMIREGTALLDSTLGSGRGRIGAYQLQAAIAAVHDRAATASETDWAQIRALQEMLERLTGNPLVTLSRAVSTARVDGPLAGLAVLDELGDRLGDHHRVEAVRGHLLELAGRLDEAAAAYRLAADRATNLQEQRHLAAEATRLRGH
ncbi:sigma factor-like helix-turn-helix DNA-binding protein [Pedococcus aerophilus]|uniref:Sigma factor-like helix-turn-helix DNA-binding protein n=1 Tax=Pedococcus aerophilus TaxID=436356 RepID=A0ABP6H780_9MICO